MEEGSYRKLNLQKFSLKGVAETSITILGELPRIYAKGLFPEDDGRKFFLGKTYSSFFHYLLTDVAGDSEFVVFMTDYGQYAGIFTCQKILFGHTKSATILSRTPTLEKAVVNQVGFYRENF